jgi:hypothetical protein
VGWVANDGGEWTEQACTELDQHDAELEPEGRQPVAAAGAETLDQTFRAELAQVVAELAEVVVGFGEVMPSQNTCVQLARGPVAAEGCRMQE